MTHRTRASGRPARRPAPIAEVAHYTINLLWDAEAGVWITTSDDVSGLVTETDTLEALFDKLKVRVPELLALNREETHA